MDIAESLHRIVGNDLYALVCLWKETTNSGVSKHVGVCRLARANGIDKIRSFAIKEVLDFQ